MKQIIYSLSKWKRCVPIIIVVLFGAIMQGYSQSTHPHILVNNSDKRLVLDKIKQQPWAAKIFAEMLESVDPYVKRHQTDSDWILSRYLMNRVPGKRYTKFISDKDGTALTGYGGDAPFPTVRVSSHKRPPVTANGGSYRMPSIEELLPYDTSMLMHLQSNARGEGKVLTDPQSFVDKINGRFNQLALNSAIIYWITGKEEYAVFAADILTQWARGASYQQPIEGPCRTGFLSIQTLGDGNYEPMPLIYDFLYEFLRNKSYETSWYESVFEKLANTMTFRGYWNNNWFAAQSPAMIFAALSLEDPIRKEYYINYFLNKDTINGSCGHLAMASVVDKWLTPDGHWKEPGGYHNYPVSSLLIASLALEKNGYNVFGKFPALLQSSFVMLKYSFPNLIAPSIGDTGPSSQSSECLELGILMAKKYGNPIETQLIAAMDILVSSNGYKRENADYLGLLSYVPEIRNDSVTTYTWPRSGELDFAKCYLQRNGTTRTDGMMYLVQGASYNHNHANGMSLELYGKGSVMGVDPGKGITYEAPMHVNYYAQWAAHNTVVAGGASASVPYFKGGGGRKNMGEIRLEAMEPMGGKEAVSPLYSFTDTRYTDLSTGTKQQRTLALVRISNTSGYYVDIYRSAHPLSNEYLYHNIGNSISLSGTRGETIQLSTADFPILKKPYDPPGFRMIKDIKSTGTINGSVRALFELRENGDNRFMQVLFAGEKDRTYFTGNAPASPTADTPYRNMVTPSVISRQNGEAWKRPFVAVFEPFAGANNHVVESIQVADNSDPGNFTALNVRLRDGSKQLILQSLANGKTRSQEDWKFNGVFGLIHLGTDTKQIYLGEGSFISWQNYSLRLLEKTGSANLEINGNNLRLSCNQPTLVTFPGNAQSKVRITQNGVTKSVNLKIQNNIISFTVPAGMNMNIQIS